MNMRAATNISEISVGGRRVIIPPFKLTENQTRSFDDFMLEGTSNMLSALETVFGLSIECSDSSIEIATYANNQNLKHFGDGPLYIISSALMGEISGSIVLFMKAEHFNHLSVVMKPVMKGLYLSATDTDLSVEAGDELKAGNEPDDGDDPGIGHMDETIYRDQMMDALAEMGNILIGLNTKSIYKICGLTSHHSVPLIMKDSRQKTTQRILSAAGGWAQLQMAIENEFFLNDRPIKLWCLILPSKDAFREMLNGIDRKYL